MSWRIPLFGSQQQQQQQQQQQPEPNFQNISTQSWYPPSVVGSCSHPSTPSSSGASPHQRASDHSQPSSRGQPSPAEAAGIISRLKDKSVDELQRLLKDKEAYNVFFNSLDQVKTQNNLRGELRKETLQLARENLEKEQRISELRNQCTIIRTTEVAAAEDRLADLERQKDEIMKSCSPAALLDKLQSTMARLDEDTRSSWRRTWTCPPWCTSTRSSALPTTSASCSTFPARPRFADTSISIHSSSVCCGISALFYPVSGGPPVPPVFDCRHQTEVACIVLWLTSLQFAMCDWLMLHPMVVESPE